MTLSDLSRSFEGHGVIFMPINGTCVQTTYVFKLVRNLSIGAISNDLERTLTLFSQYARSGHSLTLNISQMATDTAIVTTEGERKPHPSF